MLRDIFKRNRDGEQATLTQRVFNSAPRDNSGRVLCLDDRVSYNGARYNVIAMSHRGKVCIRHIAVKSRNHGRWVPSCEVKFLAPASAIHDR